MSKALVNRFFNEVMTQHNLSSLDEMLHPSFHSHNFPPPSGSDRANFIQAAKDFITAFPDIKLGVQDQTESGTKVYSYGFWTGTHKGSFQGIAPTGKQVRVDFMDIWRVEGGKLRENWVVMDIMGLMVQLGVVPMPGTKSQA